MSDITTKTGRGGRRAGAGRRRADSASITFSWGTDNLTFRVPRALVEAFVVQYQHDADIARTRLVRAIKGQGKPPAAPCVECGRKTIRRVQNNKPHCRKCEKRRWNRSTTERMISFDE